MLNVQFRTNSVTIMQFGTRFVPNVQLRNKIFARLMSKVCTNTKSMEGVTWDMDGWLGLPLEEH